MTKPKRPRSPFKDERSCDLRLWPQNGSCCGPKARFAAEVVLSVGRTGSKRGMGFLLYAVDHKKLPRFKNDQIDFVLDRDQVEDLMRYLQAQLNRLCRPLGPKTADSRMWAAFRNPAFRLERALENAAIEAHPGWHKDDPEEGLWSRDPGTPEGAKLIKWFKKTHPRKARRIEREFTKRLGGTVVIMLA
jgi:hypothetical protein